MLNRAVTGVLRSEIARRLIAAWCNSVAPRNDPWFDTPNPEAAIRHLTERGRIGETDAARLRQWNSDGYFVVKNAIAAADVDAVARWIDALAAAETPIRGVTLLGIRESRTSPPMDMSHRAFLQRYPLNDRVRILAESSWRVHGLHRWHRTVQRIFRNAELLRNASLVFQHPAVPNSCIMFARGSGQALHQDMAVFHIQPRGYLLGCWIACEDIPADSGPLVYCPGSHHTPPFPEFSDYPRTNLRTCAKDTDRRYHAWVAGEADKFERKRFLARKGDALFWHAMLFHGGDAIQRERSTRKSLVIHYTVRGSNRAWAVPGPFNW